MALIGFICTPRLLAQPKQIIVNLVPVFENRPFSYSRIIAWSYTDSSVKYSGIPKNILAPGIREFNYQRGLFYYQLFRQHKLSERKFAELMKTRKIDTTKLTILPVKQHLAAMIGFDKDSNYVVILDANFNNDFSDDSLFVYPRLSREKQKTGSENIPWHKVDFEYWDGHNIVEKKVDLRADPYKGGLVFSDSVMNKLFLGISIKEHLKGNFSAKGKDYEIRISNGFCSATYDNLEADDFLFGMKDSIRESNRKTRLQSYEEILNLDGWQYQISSVSADAKTLTLEFRGVSNSIEVAEMGDSAPEITANTMDNSEFSLSEYKGKYVLLDFWGTWCVPCLSGIPKLKQLYEKFQNKPFEIVGIAVDEDAQKVKKIVKGRGIPWTQIFQNINDKSNTSIQYKYKVSKYPSTFLLNPEGKIIAIDPDYAEIVKLLQTEFSKL